MIQRIGKFILYCLAALVLTFNVQASLFGSNSFVVGNANTPFLLPEQAFVFRAVQQGEQLHVEWKIAPEYYLYKHQLIFTPFSLALGRYTLPPSKAHYDDIYGDVDIFEQKLSVSIPLQEIQDTSELKITYQGCAKNGFCYPPATQMVKINPIDSHQINNQEPIKTASLQREKKQILTFPSAMPFSPFLALFIGIGIAFTPCVLPMYPLISGIILGRQQRRLSKNRIFWLSFVYVQGMALTYTSLGLVVAMAGLQFQAVFQHPYVLIGLSSIFILLALSMFGAYSLQLPAGIQTKLASWSNTQQGGSLLGVFVMGAVAGLICSPCTTAPLSAILLYIAQSGNLFAGGGTLYLYALGMGLPLIIVTLFGNRFLPRNGPWMQHIKEAFGFVILALPIFLMTRILDDVWELRLWWSLILSFLIWALLLSLRFCQNWGRLLQILLFAAVLISVRPIQDWLFGASTSIVIQQRSPQFKRINSIENLEYELKSATNASKQVMLDFYADWCVACKEFDKYTFSDTAVQEVLSNMVLLQVDVTGNDEKSINLMKELQVVGLPTILFFDSTGRNLVTQRVSGFMSATDFLEHLNQVIKEEK